MRYGILVFLLCGAAFADPIVIAHRGASGYLPEHTLEAYAMAYALGADYIEPDLVRTKDGAFICLHDIHLEATTDVEERFPERKRGDGRWYAIDFTLEELRGLSVHERLPARFPMGASNFRIPTFQEMIELVQGLNESAKREVGIYPELKLPAFHAKEGQPMEADFLAILRDYGYSGPEAKVFVQCFEAAALKKLRMELGAKMPMVQLVSGNRTQDALVSDPGLDEIATYANGIGPDKRRAVNDPSLVERAHARKLVVHPYTVRRDQLPKAYATTQEELRHLYFELGVDGLFTDFPGDAAAVLAQGPAPAAAE